MTKVKFSARKDPLLRRPESQPPPANPPASTDVDEIVRTASDAAGPANPSGVDKPSGDLAEVWVDRSKKRRDPRTSRAQSDSRQPPPPSAKAAAGASRSTSSSAASREHASASAGMPSGAATERGHRGGRRVQTSLSLPPGLWDSLDALAAGAGASTGELLTAILTRSLPPSPGQALSLLEQLLPSISPQEGLQEERNYRVAFDLRSALDALSEALGPRPWSRRSLLIRAIVASAMPDSPEQAREVLTTWRIDAMRAAVQASTAA
jgi:hypothetical protein